MNRVIRGIVVKEQPNGEKGKLLYVLTQDEGVIIVGATGARSIKASYLKSAQLFAYSDLSVYDKNGKLTLTEATLIESFYSLRNDITVFAAASYMTELACLTAVPGDDGILRLLLNCLFALSNDVASVAKVKAVFEYRLCLSLGIAPDFSCCAVCGKPGTVFSVTLAELYCAECAPNEPDCRELDEGVIKACDYLNGCAPSRILAFTLTEESEKAFAAFCEEYLLYTAELEPKSLAFYKSTVDGELPKERKPD